MRLVLSGLPWVLRQPDTDILKSGPVLLGCLLHNLADISGRQLPVDDIGNDISPILSLANEDACGVGRVALGGLLRGGKVPAPYPLDHIGGDGVQDFSELGTFEEQAGGGLDFPVALQEPFPVYQGHGLQVGEVAGVPGNQRLIVIDGAGDEGDRLGLAAFLRRGEVELLPQLLFGVCPIDDFIPADHPADRPAPFWDGVSGLLVPPPFDELRHPAISVRVASGPNVGLDATGRAVTGQHIEERLLGEVGQLIEAQAANLAALIVIQLPVSTDVLEHHLRDNAVTLVSEQELAFGQPRLCAPEAVVHL